MGQVAVEPSDVIAVVTKRTATVTHRNRQPVVDEEVVPGEVVEVFSSPPPPLPEPSSSLEGHVRYDHLPIGEVDSVSLVSVTFSPSKKRSVVDPSVVSSPFPEGVMVVVVAFSSPPCPEDPVVVVSVPLVPIVSLIVVESVPPVVLLDSSVGSSDEVDPVVPALLEVVSVKEGVSS